MIAISVKTVTIQVRQDEAAKAALKVWVDVDGAPVESFYVRDGDRLTARIDEALEHRGVGRTSGYTANGGGLAGGLTAPGRYYF